jgi:hypothetical protein
MAKRITRREFHWLAALGVFAAPLAGASVEPQQPQPSAEKPPVKPLLTAEMQKRVNEEVAEREEEMAAVHRHTLPYGLEPAFLFRARVPKRRAAIKVPKG